MKNIVLYDSLEEAKEKGEVIKKEKILQAKEKFLQLKSEHEKMVNEKPGFVVSTTYCPYCNKAKSLLNRYNIQHDEVMLDKLEGMD